MLKQDIDGTFTYKGQMVVKHSHNADGDTVEITLTYKTTSDGDWIIPISYLASGLQQIEPLNSLVTFEVTTSEDDIEEQFDCPRFLIEKIVKSNRHIWKFHKTDIDPWPSPPHGHDYEQGLTIDAVTGDIFDSVTRNKRMTLKRKALSALHIELRTCNDMKDLVDANLPS